MLTLYFHVRHRNTGKPIYIVPGSICFVLALLSKETALVTPLLVLAVDLLFFLDGTGRIRRAVKGVTPFVLAGAAYLLFRFTLPNPPNDKVADLHRFDWDLVNLPLYFLMEFVPVPGTLFSEQTLEGLAIPGALLMAAVLVWVFLRRRRWMTSVPQSALAVLPFSVIFFLVTTAPFLPDVLSLRRRYAYPGSFGACLFLAAALMVVSRSDARWRRLVGKGTLTVLLGA